MKKTITQIFIHPAKGTGALIR